MFDTEKKLFEGVNKIISEKYAQMRSGTKEAVSDLEDKPKNCSQLDENQDYNVCMDKDEFESKVKKLGLDTQQNGKDHFEVKDEKGDMKAWWNGHTGVGYIHKSLNESTEDQLEALKIAIQTSIARAKESPDASYHSVLADELKKNGLDPMRTKNHDKLDQAASHLSNGLFSTHGAYAQSCITGGQCNTQPEIENSTANPTDTPSIDPTSEEDKPDPVNEELLQEKVKEHLGILNQKRSEYDDKYGELAESIINETALKLAKNDLGVE